MEIRISDIERLPEAAAQFVGKMKDFPSNVYAFHAPMGAGKTTFISEVCRLLGCEDEANSPTFSIVNEYDTREGGKVYHLDCYRMESEEEAFDIGVDDYFASMNPCFVEWPENIEALLPPETVRVEITVKENGERIISIP